MMAKRFEKAFWLTWIVDATLLVLWFVFDYKENY